MEEKGGIDFLLVVIILAAIMVVWLFSTEPVTTTNIFGVGTVGTSTIQSTKPTGSSNNSSSGQTTTGATNPAAKVTIDRGRSSLYADKASQEYIGITADRKNTGPVSLAGWKIQSPVSGESYPIPAAVTLSYSSRIGDAHPIALMPGETVIISTGRSPTGESFKINKCSGYLSQFQNFSPSLSTQCPLPKNELIYSRENAQVYGDGCFDYIENMPRCRVAPAGSIPINLPPMCHNFIATRMTYNGCVDAHKGDADFYSSEWRVFLNREKPIWRKKREEIDLVNQNGVVVDSYSY